MNLIEVGTPESLELVYYRTIKVQICVNYIGPRESEHGPVPERIRFIVKPTEDFKKWLEREHKHEFMNYFKNGGNIPCIVNKAEAETEVELA